MVRRRLLEERHYGAAVRIQSQVRGYLQRVAYRRQLAEHRRNMLLLTTGTYRPGARFSKNLRKNPKFIESYKV